MRIIAITGLYWGSLFWILPNVVYARAHIKRGPKIPRIERLGSFGPETIQDYSAWGSGAKPLGSVDR